MVSENVFIMIGLGLTAFGVTLNPLRTFNGFRLVFLGLSLILSTKFGFNITYLASTLFLFNKNTVIQPMRVIFAIPISLLILKPKFFTDFVLKIFPNVSNPLLIGVLILTLTLVLILQNKKKLRGVIKK